MRKLLILLSLTAISAAVSGCVPLALGAAGAVVADEAVEDRQGGDGLF